MPDENVTDAEEVALYLSAGDSDEYKLAQIGFEPDVIYDIGADVGSVTMFANRTYPNAKIVSVEPNPWSFRHLSKHADGIPEIVPIHAAAGVGQMYEPTKAEPLHWMVVGRESPSWHDGLKKSDIPSVTLGELHKSHGGVQYVVKIDCESAEYGILTHPDSRQMILGCSYFAAEFHYWGRTHDGMMVVVNALELFLFELAQTHTVYSYAYGACKHVWAKRRIDNSVEGMDWK